MATWPDFLFLNQNSSYFCCQQGSFASTLTLDKSLVRYGNAWAVQFRTRQASLNPPFVMVCNVFANVDYGHLYSAVAVDEGAHSVPCHELSWPPCSFHGGDGSFPNMHITSPTRWNGRTGHEIGHHSVSRNARVLNSPHNYLPERNREQTFVQHDLAATEGDWWDNPSRLNVPWRCWEYSCSIRVAHL